VTSTSCEAFDAITYSLTSAESWTLHAKKGVAYVIRVRHQSGPGLTDALDALIQIYGRDAQGDMNFLTARWDTFGADNGNGGSNEEMFFATGVDRTVSIRVSADTKADTGAYSLIVQSCPMATLDGPVDSVTIDLTHGCRALTLDAQETKASFFSFVADSSVEDTTVITRTDGAASFLSHAASPRFDVNCITNDQWNDDCVSSEIGLGTSATHYLTPNMPAQVAGWVAIRADSAAKVSVLIGAAPPSSSPAMVHAPTARIIGRRSGRN
jgi:hypothetical protein